MKPISDGLSLTVLMMLFSKIVNAHGDSIEAKRSGDYF